MAKKLWDSRFKKKPDALAEEFLKSISFDKKLAKYDIKGSIAHAKMLGKCNIIDKSEADALVKGLKSIKKTDIDKIDKGEEDIHTAITNLLYKKIGKTAGKLHTARSRNDQVVGDMKMYYKDMLSQIVALIEKLQNNFLKLSKKNIDIVVPAYTHMQPAQCVLLSHYILAYVEMLERDKERMKDAYKRTDESPLGSCALSGTSMAIDRKYVAKLLNFSKVASNSIDAVSDRDFAIEILSAISILSMHMSRISEDLILWSTKEYGFIDIDEAFCTGSSIMPHKKNPDVLEYIRGYAGKFYGNLISLLVTMKGLPLTYNRDMQHDKTISFDSVEATINMLKLLAKLINNVKVNKNNIKTAIEKDNGIYSVDFVEHFVKNQKMSYRGAHKKVGEIMIDHYKNKSKKFNKKLFPGNSYKELIEEGKACSPKKSVDLKTSIGGTATKCVREQIKKWKDKLKA
jgi:argininosuccinate lyase